MEQGLKELNSTLPALWQDLEPFQFPNGKWRAKGETSGLVFGPEKNTADEVYEYLFSIRIIDHEP